MSYYRQQNRYRLSIGQDGDLLIMLIAIHLVVFVLLAFIKVIYFFSYGNPDGVALYRDNVLHWLTLPASLSTFIVRPWTLLTHMFVHDNVWHLISNMLWLWAFGFILRDIAGNKKLVPVFLYGALAGAVAYMAAYNLIPALKPAVNNAMALGASAGVMAVALTATILAPDYRIFPMINGGIPLWVITAIYVIIDLATIPYNNPGGHIAHLAGGGMGVLFVVMLRKGYDWSTWPNQFFDWVNNLFNPDKPKKGKSIKTQTFYKSSVPPYKKTLHLSQQKIDELLDKIHQKGYHSLSEEERELLKRASKEDL